MPRCLRNPVISHMEDLRRRKCHGWVQVITDKINMFTYMNNVRRYARKPDISQIHSTTDGYR